MAQAYYPVPMDGPAPGVRFAGPGARLIAYFVDGFVAAVICWIAVFVLGIGIAAVASTGSDAATALSVLFTVGAILAIALLYYPFFWVKRGGQTPGMKVMRIRVVRDVDGGPIGWGSGILRLIGYAISGMVFYLGFIWILVDRRRRGWHDLIAGTCVVEV